MDDDFLRDLLGGVGALSFRRMFSGKGVFCRGLMFALVFDDEVFIKADAQSLDAFHAAGSTPFVYKSRVRETVSVNYWRLPEAAFDDPEMALEWARRGFAAALRANAAKPAKRRKEVL